MVVEALTVLALILAYMLCRRPGIRNKDWVSASVFVTVSIPVMVQY